MHFISDRRYAVGVVLKILFYRTKEPKEAFKKNIWTSFDFASRRPKTVSRNNYACKLYFKLVQQHYLQTEHKVLYNHMKLWTKWCGEVEKATQGLRRSIRRWLIRHQKSESKLVDLSAIALFLLY